MSGKIVRKREGKGERIALPVSPETKNRWEAVNGSKNSPLLGKRNFPPSGG